MDGEPSFLDYSFINFANSTESLLTTSQYAKVIFHNIEEKYDVNNDLVCKYSLTEQFNAQSGDRIILFKLGWQQVTDYILFEWISLTEETSSLHVCFKAANLPRDENEFYQLCYISGENNVCGASIPFQFDNSKDNLVISDYFVSLEMDSTKTLLPTSSLTESRLEEHKFIPSLSDDKSSDFTELIEENKQLRIELQKTNSCIQNCDCQISELKVKVDSLNHLLCSTQNDVIDLKLRMDVANEEYKKLYADKARTEKKYEKLVKKCHGKAKRNSESNSDLSSDFLGELEPLPPFPILM